MPQLLENVTSQQEMKPKMALGLHIASWKANDIFEVSAELNNVMATVNNDDYVYEVSLVICDSNSGVVGVQWNLDIF